MNNKSMQRGACTRCDTPLPHPKHPNRRCTMQEWANATWRVYDIMGSQENVETHFNQPIDEREFNGD